MDRSKRFRIIIEKKIKIINDINVTFANNEIKNITIPNSVTIIGQAAFNSNQLSNVTIPDSVVSIGYIAFGDNPLSSIIIEDDLMRFNEDWQDIGFPLNLKPE